MGNYTITTVTLAADDFDLTTVDAIKEDLNISGSGDDDFIARAISKSSAAISQFCNRVFAKQTYQDMIRLPCTGLDTLELAKLPLVSVTSITEDGTALVSGTDFEVDLENGFIYRLNSSGAPTCWSASKVIAVYVAGWVLPGDVNETLPSDVEDACIRMVKNARAKRTRETDLKIDDVAGISHREYWVPSGADSGNLPPDIEDILQNYRIKAFA